jgi:DNA-binding transcriptional ArsR family regulator
MDSCLISRSLIRPLTVPQYFYISRNMEKGQAVAALAALAQGNRLDVFRLLARAGPDGISAGRIAATLNVAPNNLTFHFNRLRHAHLVTARRVGRSIIYVACFDRMNGLLRCLTDSCCTSARDEDFIAARPVRRTRQRG